MPGSLSRTYPKRPYLAAASTASAALPFHLWILRNFNINSKPNDDNTLTEIWPIKKNGSFYCLN